MQSYDFGPQQGWGTSWKTQRGRKSLQHCEKLFKNIRNQLILVNKSTKPFEQSKELTQFNQNIY